MQVVKDVLGIRISRAQRSLHTIRQVFVYECAVLRPICISLSKCKEECMLCRQETEKTCSISLNCIESPFDLSEEDISIKYVVLTYAICRRSTPMLMDSPVRRGRSVCNWM